MARGDHLKKYYFKEGNPGGPGRPIKPDSEKEVRKFTREHVSEVFNKIIDMKGSEIELLLADPEVPLFEKAVARGVWNSSTSGSTASLENVLERIIGKVPQKFEGDPDKPLGFVVLKTPDERKKEGGVEEIKL